VKITFFLSACPQPLNKDKKPRQTKSTKQKHKTLSQGLAPVKVQSSKPTTLRILKHILTTRWTLSTKRTTIEPLSTWGFMPSKIPTKERMFNNSPYNSEDKERNNNADNYVCTNHAILSFIALYSSRASFVKNLW
jgi:hypothetical protein